MIALSTRLAAFIALLLGACATAPAPKSGAWPAPNIYRVWIDFKGVARPPFQDASLGIRLETKGEEEYPAGITPDCYLEPGENQFLELLSCTFYASPKFSHRELNVGVTFYERGFDLRGALWFVAADRVRLFRASEGQPNVEIKLVSDCPNESRDPSGLWSEQECRYVAAPGECLILTKP